MLAAATLLGACSAGDEPSPLPSPRPSRLLLFTESFALEAAPFGVLVYHMRDVAVPNSGRVDIEVNWRSAASRMQTFVTSQDCDARSLLANECTFFASNQGLSKPVLFTFSVRAPTAIRIWVLSFANVEELAALAVYLTVP
jgi:hypothetical protein